ncbi:MAG: DUF2130 domain-containing protein [Treponema sp.]|nr:DUF2130 domain-containing protein [Candidatus Treponema merdequi]
MNFTVTCPECGAKIPLDENEHEHLIAQVRNEQFEKEIADNKILLEKQKQAEIEAAVAKEKTVASNIETKYKAQIAEIEAKLSVELAKKDQVIAGLESKNESLQKQTDLTVKNAVSEQQTKILKLENDLAMSDKEHELELANLKSGFENTIKLKDEQIAQIQDFRKKLSTKMLGETLEQHCLLSFEQIHSFIPNVSFEKDNDASEGSKGDFIYREVTDDGIEVLSIMFEMKNQDAETKTKHKNEDFFKKLDTDRNKKKCEYAILVSMLEEESELYNNGIVDISHSIPKAFVIRPQFFIPVIQILRTAAWKTVESKRELKIVQEQERDFTTFENNLELFKNSLGKTFENARANHNKAIEQIKNTIKSLQGVLEILETSNNQMNTCDNKLEDFTVKKITKDAPSVLKKIEEARK